MRNRIGNCVVALAGLLWGGSVAAANDADWRVCLANSQKIGDVIYVVQSAPFDARPSATFDERMQAQRPFEAALQALGATQLRDATVECTDPEPTRDLAERAGAARWDQVSKYKIRLVKGPWTAPLQPGETEPAVLVGLGELASAATRASSPERWGLTAGDFSRLYSDGLLAKADVARRKPQLDAAAKAGDAYAQFLLALKPEGQADDGVMMQHAADQGLVRAIVDINLESARKPASPKMSYLKPLLKMAQLGSAYANYHFAVIAAAHKQDLPNEVWEFARRGLYRADAMNYAPAQLSVAKILNANADIAQRRKGRERAVAAAAQGYAPAKKFLADNPP